MKTNQFITGLYPQYKLEKREIDLLLCHMLEINSAALMIYDRDIPVDLRKEIIKNLNRRNDGMPLAYITGSKQFWTLDLKVNQHTLIPRPETEQIIEIVLQQTDKNYKGDFLDLGTGTGAIALSLAQERPLSQIIATDICSKSLKVAQYNKNKYALTNVTLMISHWFDQIKQKKFDYIVSNPPYISENDPHLKYLKYEPNTALTAKDNGLADLLHIIQISKKYLKPNATIILEHGYNQHLQVQSFLQQNCYINVKTHYDLSRTPRITTANFLKS